MTREAKRQEEEERNGYHKGKQAGTERMREASAPLPVVDAAGKRKENCIRLTTGHLTLRLFSGVGGPRQQLPNEPPLMGNVLPLLFFFSNYLYTIYFSFGCRVPFDLSSSSSVLACGEWPLLYAGPTFRIFQTVSLAQ